MKAHKLRKLADFLDQLDGEKFDFNRVVGEDDGECGTVCCAIGWTPLVFPDEVEWLLDDESVGIVGMSDVYGFENVAEKLFDISWYEAERLFSPDQQHRIEGWGNHHVCCDKATPQEVAEAIRHYIRIRS